MLSNGLQNNYTYPNDLANLKEGNIFYRLQMVDNDGKFSYSKIVYIVIEANNLPISIYPNPAHNYFIIGNYDNADIKNAGVVVTDLTGRTLINQKFNNAAEQRINISMLSGGMYIVNIVTNGKIQTQKLIVE